MRMNPMERLKEKFLKRKNRESESESAYLAKVARRRSKIVSVIVKRVPLFRKCLFVAGFAYFFVIPWPSISGKHYISENALQPGQVSTFWGWGEVWQADRYAEDVDRWLKEEEEANGGDAMKPDAVLSTFLKNGLSAQKQEYEYTVRDGLFSEPKTISGTNVYAIHRSHKSDGSEAMALAASWYSHCETKDLPRNSKIDESENKSSEIKRAVNRRGVATVLAMSKYLSKFPLWSKDIILLISDGYEDGISAFLEGYHAGGQSNLKTAPLNLTAGPIWTALNLDYPYHSFSHVGMFYEGPNSQLPNLDILNVASHVLRWAPQTPIPIRLHSDPDELRGNNFGGKDSFLGKVLDSENLKIWERGARNVWNQAVVGAKGGVTGPEGVWGRFYIDAVGLYAVPAEGPHGFHSIGKALESILRSYNNLLERLHHSVDLYLMTSVHSFVTVSNYLYAPVLIAAGCIIFGLEKLYQGEGEDKGEQQDEGKGTRVDKADDPQVAAKQETLQYFIANGEEKRGMSKNPVRDLLRIWAIIGTTHAFGGFLFWLNTYCTATQADWLISFIAPSTAIFLFPTLRTLPEFSNLFAYTLILTGLTIASISMLNFGLGALLCFGLALPIVIASCSTSPPSGITSTIKSQRKKHKAWNTLFSLPLFLMLVLFLSGTVRTFLGSWTNVLDDLMNDWQVLGTWTLPIVTMIWVPLLIQAGVSIGL